MSVPAFVTTGADSLFVGGIASSIADWWLRCTDADPVVVLDWGADARWWAWLAEWGYVPGAGKLRRLEIPPETSQRDRHAVAIREAQRLGARWCVQTDDDILPEGEFSVAKAVAMADAARTAQPAFGLGTGVPYGLVAVHLPACALPHTLGPAPEPRGRPVVEAGAKGGLRFLSASLDPERLPPYDPARRGYDPLLCDAVRAQGFAVGGFSDAAPLWCRARHLRQRYSTVWPYHSLAERWPRAGALSDGA